MLQRISYCEETVKVALCEHALISCFKPSHVARNISIDLSLDLGFTLHPSSNKKRRDLVFRISGGACGLWATNWVALVVSAGAIAAKSGCSQKGGNLRFSVYESSGIQSIVESRKLLRGWLDSIVGQIPVLSASSSLQLLVPLPPIVQPTTHRTTAWTT
jgi:hypothetical protein